MKTQKGFSLIEVLISLALVGTLAFALLDQQLQSRQFLTELIIRAKATEYLDQVSELIFMGAKQTPKIPDPYHLRHIRNKKSETLELSWFKGSRAIIRTFNLTSVSDKKTEPFMLSPLRASA